MAGLWMTVVLVFFLSVGPLNAVDQNKLAKLIQGLENGYQISGMFSFALSVESEDPKNVEEILTENPREKVLNTLNQNFVYKGTRLAVAKVKKPEHAEYRVLSGLDLPENNLLVIYSYASACPTTCTNPENNYNIINLISGLIKTKKWGTSVFVFNKIFKPGGNVEIKRNELETALKNLGSSGITLANIFRCYKPANGAFTCSSCSAGGGNVANVCIDYNAKK